MGFTGTFLVFRKNQQYYVYDEDLTKIASNYESSLGEFRKAVGETINFRKNGQIHTYDRDLDKISSRYE